MNCSVQEERLNCRLEDLEGRLAELSERLHSDCGSAEYDRHVYSEMADCELDNTIPAQLRTIQDVLTAIARTKAVLWDIECKRRAEAHEDAEIPGQVVILGFADAFCGQTARLAS